MSQFASLPAATKKVDSGPISPKYAKMHRQITFSWSDPQGNGRFWPSCDGDTPLSCLLTDDGGLSLESATAWVDEGIVKIDSVIAGKALSDDWDREDWGSSFTLDRAVIYSLHDEKCSQTLPTAAFYNCLQLWRTFLGSEQKTGSIMTITVS